MSATDAVLTERIDEVLVVTINRPEVRNAVDTPTAERLAETFLAFDADDSLKVAVLEGAEGTFCAGADLKAVSGGEFGTFPRLDGNLYRDAANGPMGPSYMRLGKPVIAAVEGYAVAGGLELALWADLRVVARDATFGVFCRRVGVPLIDGGTVRLPRLVGLSRALDWTLSGRAVQAEEAHAAGLVNKLCEPGEAVVNHNT